MGVLPTRLFPMGAAIEEKPPYATNGLAAWYDGIWNAGVGVHDSGATTWVDLTGNNNATWKGTAFSASTWHWEDDSFDFSATDANFRHWKTDSISSDLRSAINSGTATIEVAVARKANNGPVVHVANNSTVDNLIACFANDNLQGALHRTWNDGRANISFSRNSTGCASFTFSGLGVASSRYKNGVAVSGSGGTPSSRAADAASNAYLTLGGLAADRLAGSGRNIQGKIMCVRIYNRALTASEIASNYQSDKTRFGLT